MDINAYRQAGADLRNGRIRSVLKLFSFRLKTLFVVVTLLCVWGGGNLRHQIMLKRYDMQTRFVDGYRVDASWDSLRSGPKLVYMIIKIPKDGVSISSSFGGTCYTEPMSDGLAKLPHAVYLDANYVGGSACGKVWVYLYRTHEVVEVDLDDISFDITREGFSALGTTRAWKTKILPFLNNEKALHEEYVKKHSLSGPPGRDLLSSRENS